jgi:hypothetical protein
MRQVRMLLVLLLTSFLSLPATLLAMSQATEPEPFHHPQVVETRGPVMVKGERYFLWEPAEKGLLLLSGDVLRTEEGGFATLRFASGKVDIYENTVIVIPSIGVYSRNKDIREVVIDEGKTFFDINPTGVDKGFQFRTRNVQGGVKGTLFTVSYLNGGTAVNVYRGEVFLSDREGSPRTMTSLNKGDSLRVEEDSVFTGVKRFDPGQALEGYNYNTPPGLDDKGLPADYNANPSNRGIRDRGKGHGRDNAPGQNKSESISESVDTVDDPGTVNQ